jgi:hypothetical protein
VLKPSTHFGCALGVEQRPRPGPGSCLNEGSAVGPCWSILQTTPSVAPAPSWTRPGSGTGYRVAVAKFEGLRGRERNRNRRVTGRSNLWGIGLGLLGLLKAYLMRGLLTSAHQSCSKRGWHPGQVYNINVFDAASTQWAPRQQPYEQDWSSKQ